MRDFGILKGSDLVQVLSTLAQEGTLDKEEIQVIRAVKQEMGNHSELYFRSGACVYAESSDYTYRLEKLLYKKRLLERGQVEELEQAKTLHPEKSLAQLVLEQGWVSESELAQMVAHLTEIVAYEVLLWEETAFSLDKSRKPEGDLFGLGLPSEKLMTAKSFADDAEKNLPVLILMREKFTNPNMILRRQQKIEREQLSDYQYHVYRYVNNRNSIRELLQLSELGYFDTFATLFQLMSWDYIGMGKLDVPRYQRKAPPPAASKASSSPAPPPRPKAAKTEPKPVVSGPAPRPGQRQFLRRCRGSELLQILVSVLKSGHQNGKLVVDNQRQILRCELTLHEGHLVHAATTASNIRFGDLLQQKGLVDASQIREALEEQKGDKNIHLGEVLARHGLLEKADIPRLIYHQMECVIYETLAWADAKFYFEVADKIQQEEVRVDVDFEVQDGRLIRSEEGDEEDEQTRNILQEADKNLPILLMIREKMPDSRAIPIPDKPPAAALSDEQKYVLEQIDGKSSIQDLLIASKLDYFQTYTAIFQLFSMEAIQVPAPGEGPQPPNSSSPARPRQVLVPPRRSSQDPIRPVSSAPTTAPKQAETGEILVGADLDAEPSGGFEKMETLLGSQNLELLHRLPDSKRERFQQALNALLSLALDTSEGS